MFFEVRFKDQVVIFFVCYADIHILQSVCKHFAQYVINDMNNHIKITHFVAVVKV